MFLTKIKPFVLTLALLPLAAAPIANEQQHEPTYTIGSNELDVVKFIQTVAAATGKTIVLDPAVKGKVRIMTNDNPMTKDELYELFRSALELSNFAIVEVGDVTKVIPIKEARTSPVGDAEPSSGLHEIVTDVIPAKNISAAKLLAALRPMVSTNGNLTHHDGSNSIIITDTKANIDRVRRVIDKIDTAALPTTEVIRLKYSEADAMVQTLTKLEGTDKQASGLSNKMTMVADKRNNAIIVAGEDVQRARIKELIRRLDRPAAQTGNVRVIYLEYAEAKTVAETLTKVAQNIAKLTPGGGEGKSGSAVATVEADEDTNALLITAEGDTLNSLLAVVERLDIRRAQVLVEAIIVQLNITDDRELGMEWLFSDPSSGIVGAGPQGGGVGSGLAQGIITGTTESIGQGIASVGAGSALGLAGTTGSGNFLALLKALDSSSNANILSTPTLLTMDNSEAEISIGEEVPFATGSYTSSTGNVGNPFTTFQRENVGIMLKITPQINEGDKVLLDIEQEVSDVDDAPAANGGIITKQSKINTQIMAQDGEIIVLGGLMQEEADENQTQVPILGSIPILGNLFKYQETKIAKKNLMVFIRAEIVREDEVLDLYTAEKYEKIRELQLEQRQQGLALMSDEHIPVLPPATSKELNPESDAQALEELKKAEEQNKEQGEQK
ncbi:type II secretion system secretin GspD [Agaribacterium sp. ZY112]|uniref:type II secretion system secretin GspD n=1 Tax=Agaribacterium sp. ZY112 TaxID=3233574 RepID=UPI0035239D8C